MNLYVETAFRHLVNPLSWILHPTSGFVRASAGKYLHKYVNDMIAERQKLRENAATEAKDLVDLLLDARDADGQGLSHEEIRDQILTFLIAAHETSAHTLAMTISNIAIYANVAAKVQEELHQVFGNSDRKTEYEDTFKMPYLSAVIKETLRMYPTAPDVYRVATQDTELGPYKIPKGAEINIAMMGVHYNPNVWENPTIFTPERFLNTDESDAAASSGSFVGFGYGRRSCIGQNFAMLEMRLVLSTLLRKFHFAHIPLSPVILTQSITLKPRSLVMTAWARNER